MAETLSPSPSAACYADAAEYVTARIVAHTQVADHTFRVRIDCPAIASRAIPGQFAMVRIPGRSDPLLARPLAVVNRPCTR